MSRDMARRSGAAEASGGGASSAAGRCPRDRAHNVIAVPAVYASGRSYISVTMRHNVGGMPGRSTGQAYAESALSVALAPLVPLPSWQRPAVVAGVAAGLALFLAVVGLGGPPEAAESGMAFAVLLGVVAVMAGLLALYRWHRHQECGAAYAAAAALWQRAMYCTECAASWVPGDRRMIGQDQRLGWALFRRAKQANQPQASR
jgi:hypothetical protein